jgi:hypothetical protein
MHKLTPIFPKLTDDAAVIMYFSLTSLNFESKTGVNAITLADPPPRPGNQDKNKVEV